MKKNWNGIVLFSVWHSQIHMSLFKCFEQTHASIFPVKSHTMRIWCHFIVIMSIYKHFTVFLKNDTHVSKMQPIIKPCLVHKSLPEIGEAQP